MTLDTETRIETTAPVESLANPPPHLAAALLGGALLFAALYAAILFLE